MTILQDIDCYLATAHLNLADKPWAVLSNVPPTLATFELYGQRFGTIEPHFKDYKSAAFDLSRSQLRAAAALACLLMRLAVATLIATAIAVVAVIEQGQRTTLAWHPRRGLSF
ncbi:hypothetical protein IQ268_29030 [Oculatella sp. LEGE 06141]|uniref:hypothetical protein n=1 Tax=Oculatella sp. LEGE 06141 TaxID=1828648 RepID=UPI00187DF7FA|nr:hypothetical protein [Oculatella sp. LEGE 06141]MBE9182597.1 hypothetical protein [Oculatella sp. LEGE 06141]